MDFKIEPPRIAGLATPTGARRPANNLESAVVRLLGSHPKSMPRLEGETSNPSVATLVAAAVAFKVPLRDLFPDTGEEDTGM